MLKDADPRQPNTHVAREIARLIVTGVWHEGWTLPREIELEMSGKLPSSDHIPTVTRRGE